MADDHERRQADEEGNHQHHAADTPDEGIDLPGDATRIEPGRDVERPVSRLERPDHVEASGRRLALDSPAEATERPAIAAAHPDTVQQGLVHRKTGKGAGQRFRRRDQGMGMAQQIGAALRLELVVGRNQDPRLDQQDGQEDEKGDTTTEPAPRAIEQRLEDIQQAKGSHRAVAFP